MDIPAINQNDYGNTYCLASCYLAIVQYFGHDVSMQDLEDEGIITSSGWIKKWGDYFTRGERKSLMLPKSERQLTTIIL